MLFEVLAFSGLEVEPCVREGLHVGQERLNKGMEFILQMKKKWLLKYAKRIKTNLRITEAIDKHDSRIIAVDCPENELTIIIT